MLKKIFFSSFIIICLIISACSTSKTFIQLKFKDIDSAIRKVIPSHNCGCTWKDEKTKIYVSPILKQFNTGWYTIAVKSMDSINTSTDSKKVYEQFKKLDNKYVDCKRFFLEYKIQDKSDSTKYNTVGTWFHFDGYCDGYIEGINLQTLQKNTVLFKDRKKLCEK